jgi:pyruvate,orthophosphate dikinase
MPAKASKNTRKPSAAKPRAAAPAKSTKVKYVYAFGKKTDGNSTLRALLGGKGANLAEMASIGLPVPPGFTITTEVCTYFYEHGRKYPATLDAEVRAALAAVEQQQGKRFGDSADPLLFSVRSGARDSMPGMMDTILNLGLNDTTVLGLARRSGNPRFAWDCYRRFVQMYGDVVMGVQPRNEHEHEPFDEVMSELKAELGKASDTDLTAEDLQELVTRYKALIHQRTRSAFPQDPWQQLWGAVGAVFQSWHNERAIVYRQKYNIPSEWGTAVNVQTMVFGNTGPDSGTGVAFTRDPATGEKVFYGEYLINAQGEDVVAGVRTPKPIAQLAQEMPKAHKELDKVRSTLEKHFRDMQDFEFTVEDKKLYMLQTRNGKRTGLAAVRIAVEMRKERLMTEETALLKIPAESIDTLLVPVFDARAMKAAKVIARGLPAGPGAASGHIVFTASDAVRETQQGRKVVLCRLETSPEDLKGMIVAEGILTSRGGVSSHAALVARQLGKVCICGANEVGVDYANRTLKAGGVILKEGDFISIDGTTGEVFEGQLDTAASEVMRVLDGKFKAEKSYTYQLFAQVMKWADKHRRLGVRANADTPAMARQAVALGAEGIGLCRTEHMFFEGDRIDYMRQMILAKLLPFQRNDFKGLFREMQDRPVTIRLLDPPLHEFLPHDDSTKRNLAERLGLAVDVVNDRVQALHEQNPMLGHRGCRLGVTYPEITEMQARAIFEAVVAVMTAKKPVKVKPEVMIPLVGFSAEYRDQAAIVHRVAAEVMAAKGVKFDYTVGTMIEIPRAAITAGRIAADAEFFSFGTNDLTQTALGLSRDDMGSFFEQYRDKEIFRQNPFASLDQEGVGSLVRMAVEGGRATRPGLKLGICGEHGGDPDSIGFFHQVGLDYVSCAGPRVPIARLAAAQAALRG